MRNPRYRKVQVSSAKRSKKSFVACNTCVSEFEKIQTERNALLAQNNELRRLVDTDALTSLPNRRSLIFHLERAMAFAQENKSELSLVVIDIDHFKSINDTYGHNAGDEVLCAFSARLKKSCREDDFIARFGGEEFVMILPETEDKVACKLVETLRMRVQQKLRVNVDGEIISITASFGVAMLESSSDTPDSIFKRADDALYEAKKAGRNQVVRSRQAVPEK